MCQSLICICLLSLCFSKMTKHPLPFGLSLPVSLRPHFSALRTNFISFHFISFQVIFFLRVDVSICLQRSHSLSHITSDKDHFSCYHGELFLGQAILDSWPLWSNAADAKGFTLNHHRWPRTDLPAAKKSGKKKTGEVNQSWCKQGIKLAL